MFSAEKISSFKEFYKKEFGVALTDQQATEVVTKLLALFSLVYSAQS